MTDAAKTVGVEIPQTHQFQELGAVTSDMVDSGRIQSDTGVSNVNMPVGVYSFKMTVPSYAQTTVTFDLPASLGINMVYKYGPLTAGGASQWYNFTCSVRGAWPCAAINSHPTDASKIQVNVYLVDNQLGDDDPALGVIKDDITFVETSAGTGSNTTPGSGTIDNSRFTITPEAGQGGTIYPAGTESVSLLGRMVFSITPANGFHIEDVVVDGTSVGAVREYVFDQISIDHSIKAYFDAGEVKVNNTADKSLSLRSGDSLTLDVSLGSSSIDGMDGDWWLAAYTPSGWYHYDAETGWWKEGLSVSYQGKAVGVKSFDALRLNGLSVGKYTFFFGVDTAMNGQVDMDRLHYDKVEVRVSEGKDRAVYGSAIKYKARRLWGREGIKEGITSNKGK